MNNFDNIGSIGSNGSNANDSASIINVPDFSSVSRAFVTKMGFIHNALESGWSVKKNKESYVFTKKHEGKKEMFSDSYLSTFVKDNSVMAKTIF
jgi:hypothetical protein